MFVCFYMWGLYVCMHTRLQDVYMHVRLWCPFARADQAYNQAFSILHYPIPLEDRHSGI